MYVMFTSWVARMLAKTERSIRATHEVNITYILRYIQKDTGCRSLMGPPPFGVDYNLLLLESTPKSASIHSAPT